jgi:hypothetical protein
MQKLAVLLCVAGVYVAVILSGDNAPRSKPVAVDEKPAVPTDSVLQEMHDLRAELTRLDLKLRYYKSVIKREPKQRADHEEKHKKVSEQIVAIHNHIETIQETELPGFERVTAYAALDCSEEESYAIILRASATARIAKDELLLFHAGDIYRTSGEFTPLKTTDAGFYFRPDREIAANKKFRVFCIQDAPEEIENVKNGFMPDSDRARKPNRAYQTQVTISNRG